MVTSPSIALAALSQTLDASPLPPPCARPPRVCRRRSGARSPPRAGSPPEQARGRPAPAASPDSRARLLRCLQLRQDARRIGALVPPDAALVAARLSVEV